MVIALPRILAQQPLLATVKPLVANEVLNGRQLHVLAAINGVNDVYREKILKMVVNAAEQAGIEVDPDIWEALYELKTPNALARLRDLASKPSPIRFNLIDDQAVITHEDRSTLVQMGGTGHRTWESSLALTEYICHNIGEFTDLPHIIELGAGTGIVSLALAKLTGTQEIYATDGSESVVDKLTTTAMENHVENVVKPMVLDWESPSDTKKLPKQSVIIAGDILYGLTSSYNPILDLLARLDPKAVYLCNPIRNEESYNLFKLLSEQRGYQLCTLGRWSATSHTETDYMFIVSVPPIPVELIKLKLSNN